MIAGHAALAFALVGFAAARLGIPRRKAISLALAAAGFALVPDVDMAYAVLGTVQSGATGVWSATDAFWGSSKVVHRLATHSLVVGVPAVLAFGVVTRGRTGGIAGVAILGTLVVLGGVASGPLAAATLALFALGGVGVSIAARRAGLDTPAILTVAAVGILSHPFGDVFTGTAPALLYPFDVRLLPARVALHPDPTLNLLSVFALELATIWLAVLAAAAYDVIDLRATLDPRGVVGVGYGLAAFILPPPTLDVSYHFVFSVLAVGTVGVAPVRRPLERRDYVTAAITALAAVSLAGVGYTVIYLIT